MRRFRFGVQARGADSAAHWLQQVKNAEATGFDVLTLADHFNEQLGPLCGLAVAAAATTRLRVGSLVFCNDFRHPVTLAKELATLDLLSGGRLEIGLGAGWKRDEYDAAGMPYDAPGVRLDRLEEALIVIKSLLHGGEVNFQGRHYTVTALEGMPRPVQRPHPPIYIGGGGRRMLSIAARHADIVGIHFNLGEGDFTRETMQSREPDPTARKIAWVREAAGERFDALELGAIIFELIVTQDVRAAAERVGEYFGLTVDEVLASPHFLIGTEDDIVRLLEARRARYGISYWTLRIDSMADFAPILARLVRADVPSTAERRAASSTG